MAKGLTYLHVIFLAAFTGAFVPPSAASPFGRHTQF